MNLEDWYKENSITLECWDENDNLGCFDDIKDMPISKHLIEKFMQAEREEFYEIAEEIREELLEKGWKINRLWLSEQIDELYMAEDY